jgi:hypothetical protein
VRAGVGHLGVARAGRATRDLAALKLIDVSIRRPLVTTGELAVLMGISKTTIQRYYRSGDLTPAELTPAGHPGWIDADVRDQMRELRERRKQERDTE